MHAIYYLELNNRESTTIFKFILQPGGMNPLLPSLQVQTVFTKTPPFFVCFVASLCPSISFTIVGTSAGLRIETQTD